MRRVGLLALVGVVLLALVIGPLNLGPGKGRAAGAESSLPSAAASPLPSRCPLTACLPTSPLGAPLSLPYFGIAVLIGVCGLMALQMQLSRRRPATVRLRSGVRNAVLRPPRSSASSI